MTDLFPIVHEDDDLLVINKPAGLVCHPTKGDERSSLAGRVRLYLGAEAPVRLVNRLDRETSGLVVVARTLEAARELGRRWEGREVRKRYRAIVHGWPEVDAGVIRAPLGRDEGSVVAIKDCVRADGASAQTAFTVGRRFARREGRFADLRVEPLTGRKHQIRIHLQHFGHPIVGDKLYGPDDRLYLDFVEGRLTEAGRRQLILPWQALHAGELEFTWRGTPVRFEVPPERWFIEYTGDVIGTLTPEIRSSGNP
ncbi:MAG: RluA family pseudouridine synthase [Verrucomicrobiales bacterium]|nr:RluA family pseudouridine synthase [Verrucomicrobiales bacterium]